MYTRNPYISAKQLRTLTKCFALDTTATSAGELAKVNRVTANHFYRHCREIIYMTTRLAPRLFGEVEMDQSEFGGRGRKRMQALLKRYAKVMPHSEYMEKAKLIRKEHKVMVFGILQRGGAVYTHVIKRADRDTLQPIVRLVVEQGSTVLTDKWRAFDELGLDGYTHKNINHSESYSDKQGVHINGIESFWSFAKRRIAKFNGIARTTLILHIKECEWRYNNKNIESALKALLSQHQNPFPRNHADKSTSDRPSRQPLRARLRIRRKPHTDNDSASAPRVRARVRARVRLKV